MFASSNPPPLSHHHHHHNPHQYSLKLKSMFELAVAQQQQQQYLYPQLSQQQYPPQPGARVSPVAVAQPPPPSHHNTCPFTANNIDSESMEESSGGGPGIPIRYPTSPQTRAQNLHKRLEGREKGEEESQSPPATPSHHPFHLLGASLPPQQSGPPKQQQQAPGPLSSKPTAFSIESLLAHSNSWHRQLAPAAEETTGSGPSPTKKEARFSPYGRPGGEQGNRQTTAPAPPLQKGKGEESGGAKGGENLAGKGAGGTVRRATKNKRVRTIFTPEQLERLEAEFERQQYMVGPERLYLASSLYLTEAQVKVWFQNRRIKWRKQHLEMEQQRLAIYRTLAEQDMLASSSGVGSLATSGGQPGSLALLDEDSESNSSRGTTEVDSVLGDEDDSQDKDYEERRRSKEQSLEPESNHPVSTPSHTPPNRHRVPLQLNNSDEFSDESHQHGQHSQQHEQLPCSTSSTSSSVRGFEGLRRGGPSTNRPGPLPLAKK